MLSIQKSWLKYCGLQTLVATVNSLHCEVPKLNPNLTNVYNIVYVVRTLLHGRHPT